MIWQPLKSFLQQFGLFREPPVLVPNDWGTWHEADFFTIERRKTEKLASLARYIIDARELMNTRKRQKKAHLHIAKAIQDACTERLEIELGRRIFDGVRWVLK